jgi:type IV pilus assembly protein PilY1
MRCSKSRFLAVTTGALLAMAAGSAALADDTEIFFNQNNGNIPANIMFVLDTSGSMNSLVATQQPYEPSVSYTADQCGSAFDTNAYYYSTSGIPGCGSTAKIAKTLFKCNAMLAPLTSAGFATDAFVQWGSTVNSTSRGRGTVAKPRITTTTSTYGWAGTLNSANTTGFAECKADAGIHGDGANLTKLFASTDTFSMQTTTTTPPGTVVVNSDNVTGFPERLVGVWDATKNYFGANSGGTYTIYTANYLSYINDSSQASSRSKMSIMHDAAASLLGGMTGVNVGLMRYSHTGLGGMVLAPVASIDAGTNRTDDINLVRSWAPSGVTPLSQTFYEAYLYFTGNAVRYGNGSTSTTCTSWSATDGTCGSATSFAAPSVPSSRTGGTPASANYDSPADFSCRKNFIVYLTDGLPNETADADASIRALGVTCDTTTFSGANGGKCLRGLAGYMYNNDMRPDVAKVQNVTSYFIGFGTDFASGGAPTAAFTYLDNAATAGGGKAYTATNLTELTSAFNDILNSVIKTNTQFSAPAVAVNAFNRTQTLNDLYVSVFSPRAAFHWPGNVKKYKVINSQVVDSLGAAAVDPNTGFFTDGARSYWSSAVDGADVTVGGAASKLPDAASRTVYTYTGTSFPSGLTPLTAASVTDADLNIGGAGDPTRDDLVDWALGLDVQDLVPVAGAGTTDSRHEMGDPIHTQPVAMIYGKNGDGTDNTVIFVPTNDGYLHAIDASATPTGTDTATSGKELWSYIPKEMLPRLKDLYNDDSTTTKQYGLDGPIAVLKYDINGDGTISGNDRVILFFGTGRNANTAAYYALEVTDKLHPQLLWTINASTLPGLGQAWSTPVITRVNVSGASPAQNSQRIVLAISGGYDAAEDNHTYYNSDTVGNHVYLVDAITGNLVWSAGASGANFNNARMDHAIPSSVAVLDLDGDGYADRMYVGDMAAQLWRFDITNGSTAANLVTGGVIASLGTKEDSVHAAADMRRFYSSPDVAAVQKPKITPFLSIALGTGYRGHPLDNTVHDRFYDVRDYNGFRTMSQAEFNALTLVRDALSSGAAASKLIDITATAAPVMPSNALGWQLDLNTHPDWSGGEKSLVPSRTFSDHIIFTTYSPNTTPPADPCTGIGTGTNRVYVVDVFSGAPVLDRNNDGTKTTDERSQDLRQGGIAPETAFLFPAPDPNGGSGGGPGGGSVTCLSGVEVLNVCTNFNQRRKTYWREGMAN